MRCADELVQLVETGKDWVPGKMTMSSAARMRVELEPLTFPELLALLLNAEAGVSTLGVERVDVVARHAFETVDRELLVAALNGELLPNSACSIANKVVRGSQVLAEEIMEEIIESSLPWRAGSV